MRKSVFAFVTLLLGVATGAFANEVWTENFTDVDDWTVVYDPGKGSTITTDGNLASLHVNAGGSEAAFIPAPDVSPYIPFEPAKKGQYTLTLSVDKITASTSYDIAIDQFKGAGSVDFISTLWQIYPTNASSVATGTIVVNLGTYNFDPATKFIMPKITVHTGNADQTLKLDLLQVTFTP